MKLLVAPIVAFFARMRFPVLFVVTALAFVADLLVPDLVPFADEIALGLLAALLAAWRKKRSDDEPDDSAGGPPDRGSS